MGDLDDVSDLVVVDVVADVVTDQLLRGVGSVV